jgi:GDP-L-fucose synthase
VLSNYDGDEPINLGGGEVCSIAELAELVRAVVGYQGELVFDSSRPDGAPFKSLDGRKVRALGWQPQVSLREGLERTYDWYLEHCSAEAAAEPVEVVA